MERSNVSVNTIKVKVHEITSITDPETGKAGKNIKLVQVKQRAQQPYFSGVIGGPGDSDIVKSVISQFQSMGLPFGRDLTQPKINLYLSESEYDLLGVRFEVNEVYDVTLKDGAIRFSKSLEGV